MKIIILLFFFAVFPLYAQFSPTQSLNQFLPGESFKLIEGENFTIIYPKDFNQEAQYILEILEKNEAELKKTYDKSFPKINIVLNHQAAIGNGFVALAPYRSYFYLFPTADYSLSGSEWLELLSIHEARHVVQFGALRRSVYRLAYFIGGEQAMSGFIFFSIPNWYFEGDAILYETILTSGGRPRNPRFGRQTRALLLAGFKPTYSQFYLRSYDYHYPDHYELGYLLMRHLKVKYGENAIKEAIHYSSEFPHPWRFSGGLNHATGKDVDEFYEEAFRHYRKIWQYQQENFIETNYTPLIEPKYFFTDYDHPQYDKNGRLYVIRSGYDFLPEVIRISSQEHKFITVEKPGILYEDFAFVSPTGDVHYSEFRPHPRFQQASFAYSNFRQKYPFLPKLDITRFVTSDEEKYGALLVVNEKREQKILLYDLSSKEKIYEIYYEKSQLQMQRFSRGDTFLDYIVINPKGRALWQLNLATLEKTELIPPSSSPIADPHGNEKEVYFSASYDGLEGIYKINRKDKKIYQVVSHRIGAFRPTLSFNQEKLVFNYHTVYGNGVGEITLANTKPIPVEKLTNREDALFDFALEKEKTPKKEIQAVLLPKEKNYSFFKSLFNIHSWSPIPDITNRDVKLSLFSDSILQEIGWSLSYIYNQNEKTHFGQIALHYNPYWPQFTLSGGYGNRALRVLREQSETFYRWLEESAGILAKIPYNYFFGHYNLTFILQSQIERRNLRQISPQDYQDLDYFSPTEIYPFGLQSLFSITRRMARRELQPLYGIEVSLWFQKNLIPQEPYRQNALLLSLYLPGFFKNHGTLLQSSFDIQNLVYFPAFNRFARGYAALSAERIEIYSFNYILPLFYPDLNFFHVLFLRRIKWNFFYDQAILNQKILYESAGGELTFDFIPFKLQIFEVDLGLRYSYLFRTKQEAYEIFLRAIRGAF